MDNVTHTLVGLMMARCGLEKTTVRGAGMMMLAANAPDIDAVFWFSRLPYLDYHRSYTHSLAMMPVIALLPMVLARVKFSFQAYLAAIAGVLSHLLLDWTNPYGIQLLLPFSHQRLRLDITGIIDPWLWLILLAGLLAPALMKLVSTEIGERANTAPRRVWAWVVLVALIAYEGSRFAMHQRALGMLESRLYQGQAPREVIAVPGGRFNPLAWRGIVRAGGFVTIVPVDVAGEFDPAAGRTYYDAAPSPAIEAAKQRPEFQTMMRFSQAQFWKVTPVEGGTLVQLSDLRFGTPEGAGFAAVSTVIP